MKSLLLQALEHHEAGRFQQAERIYRQVLAREPDNADALHLLGMIAMRTGHREAGLRLVSRAISINPDVAIYRNNLGIILRALGRFAEAEQSCRQALALDPDYIDAQLNLATNLRDQKRFAEAVAAYERAVQLAPTMADAHMGLGTALRDQGRIEEALGEYRQAIALNPNHAAAHSNLLYGLHNLDSVSAQEIYDAHREWAARHARQLSKFIHRHDNNRRPDRRLRVGYVSADFRDHPVARFLWPLIEYRDRDAFEVVCYSSGDRRDAVTEQYRAAVDEWVDASRLSDEQLAEQVRQQRIDILVDLTGHTAGGRLLAFARKPAPLQMTYLGYPDTTGLEAMDVRITDALADPPGSESRHTERLARVDGCFLSYSASDLAPITPLPAIANGHITFGSFNNIAKISPMTVRLWTRALDALPTARMIIKSMSLGDPGTVAQVRQRLESLGLPMRRVELLGPTQFQQEHLATYGRIDIALDTYPYCGTTTTCEALAMGVPVISLVGDHHAARVGLSILTAAGLADWATADEAAFSQTATALAADVNHLSQIRATLPQALKHSPLCDARAFARQIERIYRTEWRRWCEK